MTSPSGILSARAAAARAAGLLVAVAAALGALPSAAQVAPPNAESSSPPDGRSLLRADQVTLLVQTLSEVEADGFRRGEFTPAGLEDRLRSQDPAEREEGESQLRAAVVAYARAQHGLRLAASAFDKNWGMRPGPYDADADFNFALAQDRLPQWLDGLAPPFDRYRGLKTALAAYRAIAVAGGWGTIAEGPPLGEGARGARVEALRRRLAAEPQASGLDGEGSVFDAALTEAVKGFQHNVGLVQTGVVDKATLLALDAPVESRISQIEANMERWRWVPRNWPATRIEANIAGEEMDAFVDNALVLEMRAAPGRPDDQTPMLSSQVESVVFDPPWNVPSTIAAKELWPKENAHPGYLASHGYRVIATDDGGRRLQQKFGPKSSLGKIKFDFPNPYAVYLHDTPSRAAFGRTSRAVSHGCVRLQRPRELAALLFQNDADWPAERIDQVIAAGSVTRAPLPAPVPIFLMYWTAFLDVKGRVNFRPDVYGWDAQLMGLIAAVGH
jgi:murein L,D-transpeptidase YcbB/YkuD